MSPEVIQALTWVAALIVVGVYVLFVVWRYRVDKRKKEMQNQEASALSAAIAKTAEERLPPRMPSAPPVTSSIAMDQPSSVSAAPSSDMTIAGGLAGISLPNDLVPLITMAARPGTIDRVAFWTDTAPAEIVGAAFSAELERLHYAITSLDDQSLAVQRDDVRMLVVIHDDGQNATIAGAPAFATVPERSVVIEVWIPE